MILSASPNLYVRSTIPSSRYSLDDTMAALFDSAEAALTLRELLDRVVQVPTFQACPPGRDENDFAVGQLPYERPRQHGGGVEHNHEIRFTRFAEQCSTQSPFGQRCVTFPCSDRVADALATVHHGIDVDRETSRRGHPSAQGMRRCHAARRHWFVGADRDVSSSREAACFDEQLCPILPLLGRERGPFGDGTSGHEHMSERHRWCVASATEHPSIVTRPMPITVPPNSHCLESIFSQTLERHWTDHRHSILVPRRVPRRRLP